MAQAMPLEEPAANQPPINPDSAAQDAAPTASNQDTPTTDGPRGPSVFSLELATLRFRDPFTWLRLGWRDFARCPRIGLFYGLCFFVMGHALLAVFEQAPAYVLALSAGFLLLGPFLCLGLYDASKAMQTHSHRPSLRASLTAWRPTKGAMAIFAGVLLILEMLWGRASMVVFAVSFNNLPTGDFLRHIFAWENIGFLITYTVVGAVFAGLIFVTSVVSIPMIMDRQVDAVSAGLTSIRACLQNPGVMLVWGALITTVIVLAMLPWFLGLFVAGPVIGHATWHAYRHIVPTDTPPDATA